MMKGVIIAGGKGSRLFPLTKAIPKCLLPVYDKPAIYYPIETLKKFGIKDIAIVVSPSSKELFCNQLGTGEEFGVNIEYFVQQSSNGSAGAFMEASEFIRGNSCVLIYGDNLFIGSYDESIKEGLENLSNGYSSIFGVEVSNPSNYGVIEIDEDKNVVSIEEKPEVPKSNLIAPGLFVYDESVVDNLLKIRVSPRGEFEMPDVNKIYIHEDKLKVVLIDTDKCKWFDIGDIDVLNDASNEIRKLTK